jgi:GTPase SAR1 family protein
MSVNLREFLMSLAATTVSIVLTFGTTAIIDHKKQREEKREMTLMIMFDMRESLDNIRQMDADLKYMFDTQVDVVAHPGKLEKSYYDLVTRVPIANYTTTTETIFRSNIETIQTLGSILFIRSVSSFYDVRSQYKKQVADSFQNESEEALTHYEKLKDLAISNYIFVSETYLMSMTREYEKCKILMKVSEKDLDTFSQQQTHLLEATKEIMMDEFQQISDAQAERADRLRKAIEEGKKELNNR